MANEFQRQEMFSQAHKEKRTSPITHPLSSDEAVSDILKAKPEPKPQKKIPSRKQS